MKKIILGLVMAAMFAPVVSEAHTIITGTCTNGRHYSVNTDDNDRLTYGDHKYNIKALDASNDNKLVSVDYGYQVEGHRVTLSINDEAKEKIVFSDYGADGTRYRCMSGITVRNK